MPMIHPSGLGDGITDSRLRCAQFKEREVEFCRRYVVLPLSVAPAACRRLVDLGDASYGNRHGKLLGIFVMRSYIFTHAYIM